MNHVATLLKAAKFYETLSYVCTATKVGFKSPNGSWATMSATDYTTFKSDSTGMGILTGARSNLTCVDIDDMPMWLKICAYYSEDDIDTLFDDAMREMSPTGGIHYYFEYNANLKQGDHCIRARDSNGNLFVLKSKNKIAIDVRNDGGFVVCAPSLYASGGKAEKKKYDGMPYKWITGPYDNDGVLTPCPEWLVDLLTHKTEVRLNEAGDITDICRVTEEEEQPRKQTTKSGETGTKKARQEQQEEQEEDEQQVINRPATLEEIKEGLTILNPDNFGAYTDWCNLLWAVARGADAAELDEDAVLCLLDDFCKKVANYTSKDDVVKKYNESGKRNGKQSKVTFGTFRFLVKGAKIEALVSKKTHIIDKTTNSFDHKDPYKWNDFVAACQMQPFKSLECLRKFVAANINRVLAKITVGDGYYLKKDACYVVSAISGIKDNNFKMTFITIKHDKRATKNPKPATYEENDIKLRSVLETPGILKEYTMADFYKNPSDCPDGNFNQWQGVRANHITQTDKSKALIKPLLDFLYELYANSDEATYKWILAYFKAILVSGKRQKTGICLFLYSKMHGAGKNTFIDWFRMRVVGKHASYSFTGLAQMCDKHNTLTEGRIFTTVDEIGAVGARCAELVEIVKSNITADSLHINPKGLAMKSVVNLCNWIMMSNLKESLLDEHDRRFTCLEINQKYTGNVEYWEKLHAYLDNQDVADAFYTYLVELDTSSYPNPHKPHDTELRRQMMKFKESSVVLFVNKLIKEENYKRCAYKRWKDNGANGCSPSLAKMTWAADELYAAYRSYCEATLLRSKPRPYYDSELNNGPKNVPLLEKKKNSKIYYVIPEEDEEVDEDDEVEDDEVEE